jgi:cysteinyl-tRNA synthetase
VSAPPLQVLDPRTRARRPFVPVRPGEVGMYVCGLTVQDRPHLGHMYAFVACDVVRRYLEHLGYRVTHVQNFTDIDDKIIERARREGIDAQAVAERNIAAFHEAAAALQLLPAHHYPRVTEHIPEVVALVGRLIERGHAYEAGGDVYFRVRSWEAYGQLSGRDVDEMRSGVRVEVGDRKEDPLDFALWKRSRTREPGWDSPWGRGRPGWHIECSAMAIRYLGEHFDFHGGGRDLLFPHHENELAQSCCATGAPYVNHWLHNGLLYLGKSKMSKSDGNFLALDALTATYPPPVLRFFLLNCHFRSQLDFGEDRLREAAAGYERLRRGARRLLVARAELRESSDHAGPLPEGLISAPGSELEDAVEGRGRRFFAAMSDDFNAGGAVGELFGLVRDLNHYFAATGGAAVDPAPLDAAHELFADADRILGLFPAALAGLEDDAPPGEIAALAEERESARAERDWARSDALRDRIQEAGWEIADTARGPRLTRRDDGV